PATLSVCWYGAASTRETHPFPTRRSSDLGDHRAGTGGKGSGRGGGHHGVRLLGGDRSRDGAPWGGHGLPGLLALPPHDRAHPTRSEEHTSELQSREKLVCRLLLEKKKTTP